MFLARNKNPGNFEFVAYHQWISNITCRGDWHPEHSSSLTRLNKSDLSDSLLRLRLLRLSTGHKSGRFGHGQPQPDTSRDRCDGSNSLKYLTGRVS